MPEIAVKLDIDGQYRALRDLAGLVDRSERAKLVGPAAAELTGAGPLTPEYAHREIAIGGARARAVATDVGIDLIIATNAEPVRRALVEAGAVEVSEAAAEIVRVEGGRPRFGA